MSEVITQADLNKLEQYLDSIYQQNNIDFEFTRHFLNRVNDMRNKKPITVAELKNMFTKAQRKYGKKISQMGPDKEAVISDLSTKLNTPFVLRWDKDNEELDLVAKTVMRKNNFRTSDATLQVENNMDPKEYHKKKRARGLPDEVDVSRFPSRPGLEGPFKFKNERVLYYDPKLGQYYDSEIDSYLDHSEVLSLAEGLFGNKLERLRSAYELYKSMKKDKEKSGSLINLASQRFGLSPRDLQRFISDLGDKSMSSHRATMPNEEKEYDRLIDQVLSRYKGTLEDSLVKERKKKKTKKKSDKKVGAGMYSVSPGYSGNASAAGASSGSPAGGADGGVGESARIREKVLPKQSEREINNAKTRLMSIVRDSSHLIDEVEKAAKEGISPWQQDRIDKAAYQLSLLKKSLDSTSKSRVLSGVSESVGKLVGDDMVQVQGYGQLRMDQLQQKTAQYLARANKLYRDGEFEDLADLINKGMLPVFAQALSDVIKEKNNQSKNEELLNSLTNEELITLEKALQGHHSSFAESELFERLKEYFREDLPEDTENLDLWVLDKVDSTIGEGVLNRINGGKRRIRRKVNVTQREKEPKSSQFDK